MIVRRKLYTIDQVSYLMNVTRQAVYIAITKGKLKAKRLKPDYVYHVVGEDLKEYIENKYSRKFLKYENGKKVFDNEKGRYSVSELSKELNVPQHRIYYALRNNIVPYDKFGSQYVFNIKDKKKFRQLLIRKIALTRVRKLKNRV